MSFESGSWEDSDSSPKMVKYLALKGLYDVEKTIGAGGFAKVKMATHLLTGEKVAIKIMDKASLGEDYPRVKLELEALKSISHHHICKLFQVIDTDTHIFMVMEYCSGGELFDHIVEKSKLTESESRTFFRQITSAVAYLHKVGYAHRDLKPENILLDRDLNLKLIDFGLCAKPFGGMESHLQTSCGSPTYAAPELIKGQQYLGSQVDVWSMGVLLYALLCGFLPFDCDNIESLYKKILSGRYEEPPWLSRESRQIIKDMLQVDPKKRITVENLLSHPWMTVGVYEPVSLHSLHEYREKDDVVLYLMADFFALTPKQMWHKVNTWTYDYITATYLLLLTRRKAGQPLKLSTPRFILRSSHYSFRGGSSGDLPWKTSLAELTSPNENISNNNQLKGVPLNAGDPRRLVTTPRKVQRKRGHDCTTDEESPASKRRTPLRTCTPRRASINSTPRTEGSPATPSTPGYKFLQSIEKKIKQVRQVLTPRKRKRAGSQPLAPAVLSSKEVYNVSTTSSVEPLRVMEELKAALERNDIPCTVKGYNIRGKVLKGGGTQCKLSFELEVVLVASSVEGDSNAPSYVVGIKRKRLKGDAWFYKKVCEEVLTLARHPQPSPT